MCIELWCCTVQQNFACMYAVIRPSFEVFDHFVLETAVTFFVAQRLTILTRVCCVGFGSGFGFGSFLINIIKKVDS